MERTRLVEAIGTTRDRANLTIVHGAAGAGKSTALTQWANTINSADEDLVWITLYPDDSESMPFWSRIAASLVRHHITSHLGDRDTVLDGSGEIYDAHTKLIAALSPGDRPLTIVLDDYHLVAGPAIDHEVQQFLRRCDGVRMVVGTRTMSDLHSVTFAAQVDTRIIATEELAFTLDESTRLIATRISGDSTEVAKAIHSATHGWPLASQAMLVELERDPSSRPSAELIGDERSLFVEEMVLSSLEERSQASRDFLLRIALADELTVTLAAEITPENAADAIREFEKLERDGIGSWQIRSGVAWFRMHPMLLESFQRQSDAQLDPAVTSWVRGVLSDRLQRTRPLHSLELAVRIADWRRVEDLFFLRFGLLTNFHRESSARLLFGVPPEALASNPSLFATKLVYEFGAPRASGDYYANNYPVLRTANRTRPLREPSVAAALGEIMWTGVHRLFGDQATALTLADRAAAALEASTVVDREENREAVALLHIQLGVTHMLAGEYLRAIDDLTFANSSAQRDGSWNEAFQAQSMLAFTSAIRGDIGAASEWVDASAQESTLSYDGWLGKYLGAGRRIANTYVHLNRWDFTGAHAAIAELELRSQGLEYWPDMLIARAWTDLLRHGPDSAQADLSASIADKTRRAPAQEEPGARLSAMHAQLLLLSGQPVRAVRVLDEVGLATNGELRIVRARLAKQRGDYSTAMSVADEIAWSSPENPRLRSEAFLVVAAASLDAGHVARAVENFAAAIGTLSNNGLRLPLLTVSRDRLNKLIALTAEHGTRVDEAVFAGMPSTGAHTVHVESLSSAERRVLRALVASDDVNRAAEVLHLSAHTIRYHLKRSYKKLGVSTRAEAITLAQQLGMLD